MKTSWTIRNESKNKKHWSNYLVNRLLRKKKKNHRWSSSVHLQGSDSGHQHHHVGSQAWVAALDVEELLHANVSTKSGLCHCWHNWQQNNSCQEHWVKSCYIASTNLSTTSTAVSDHGTYPQSPPVQLASKLFYLPRWRSCHGRCWQTGRHGQTQGFPADSNDSHVTQNP